MMKETTMAPVLADNNSIQQFCRWAGITDRQLLRERVAGRGPRILKIGRRIIITREAALEWRKQREHS